MSLSLSVKMVGSFWIRKNKLMLQSHISSRHFLDGDNTKAPLVTFREITSSIKATHIQGHLKFETRL